jgi:SAM-dependent methyltransferase
VKSVVTGVRSPAVTRDVFAHPPPRRQPGISRRSLFRLGLRDVDYDGAAARVRAAWDSGGHEPWLRVLEPAAEVLVELAGVGPGVTVLDAAAGDGNVAAAALARDARVDACDVAPALVARGRERCPGARWRVGDVQALPYADRTFDAVLSSFGAVVAPRPRRTARELVRVARPGGTVALTAWVPRGLPGRMDELVELVAPLPDGVRPPADWGARTVAMERLSPLLDELELRTRVVSLEFADADAFFDALARPAGLDGEERAAIRPAFDEVLASCNTAAPAVRVDARYLIALGRRPV